MNDILSVVFVMNDVFFDILRKYCTFVKYICPMHLLWSNYSYIYISAFIFVQCIYLCNETKLVVSAFSPLCPSVNVFDVYIWADIRLFLFLKKSSFHWIASTIFPLESVFMEFLSWNPDFIILCTTSKTFAKQKRHSFDYMRNLESIYP